MSKKILNYLIKAMDYSKRAVLSFRKNTGTVFLYNTMAGELFLNEKGVIDIHLIFSKVEKTEYWENSIMEQLSKEGSVTIYDLPLWTNSGKTKVADVQLGYADDENRIIFAEFFFKEDSRMEQAISQVNQSIRAEGIFEFDQRLSLIHCNDLFYQVFASNQEKFKTQYENQLSNGFPTKVREKLLQEIQGNLKKYPSYFTKMKVITSNGEERWFSLELQRRTLDDSGTDKLMAYMVNIEKQVETENELDSVNQYFEILQEMSKGLLYRFDIHNRTLYRNESTAKLYNMPMKQENFPTKEWLDYIMHPDDIAGFLSYIDVVLTGQEAKHTARFKTAKGDLEYHTFTFSPVYHPDGAVKEMLGCAVNIQEKHDLESTAENVQKQFDIIEKVTEENMFQVDLDSRTLVHRGNHAAEIGVPTVEENFPDCVYPRVHPDDLENYRKYTESVMGGTEGNHTFRMKVAHSKREYEWFEIHSYIIFHENGTKEQIVGTVKNVHSQQEMIKRANTDMLTGCLNKMATLEQVSEMLKNCQINHKHALLFLDLDDFKYVNDNLGHAFGDYLLKELGSRLMDNVRLQDLVGRVGGDEFVIFLQNIPNEDVLMGKGKIILSSISEDFDDGTNKHTINGSIGIAVYPDHGGTYEELYHHADLALYHSKRKGKNQVSLYSEDLNEKKKLLKID